MVVDNAVIVELKATETLSPAAKPQLISYLRASLFEVGLLLHFGPSPRFYRFVDHPKLRHGSIRVHSCHSCPKALGPDSADDRIEPEHG